MQCSSLSILSRQNHSYSCVSFCATISCKTYHPGTQRNGRKYQKSCKSKNIRTIGSNNNGGGGKQRVLLDKDENWTNKDFLKQWRKEFLTEWLTWILFRDGGGSTQAFSKGEGKKVKGLCLDLHTFRLWISPSLQLEIWLLLNGKSHIANRDMVIPIHLMIYDWWQVHLVHWHNISIVVYYDNPLSWRG